MIRDLLRKVRRRLVPQPTFSIDEAELRHLDGEVRELVRSRLISGEPKGFLDGERSVRLPHPSKPGFEVKIKGVGFFGGPVQFGRYHRSRLKAPVFDFDGRMMVDVASGHDAAYLGGASFQQVATEYRMAKLLAGKGYQVVPCLGYGRLRHRHLESWFSIHETRADWMSMVTPHVTMAEYAAAKVEVGRVLLELAVEHGLVGYAWFLIARDRKLFLKDLHPFRMADPVSMSRVSWVMQVFFGLHIVALAAAHFGREGAPGQDPGDVQVAAFKSLLPMVTIADHQALRGELVRPYMLGPPEAFDAVALARVLSGNPITRALLDICPAAYERY